MLDSTLGAVKPHTQLNPSGQIPSFLSISDGKTHELTVVKRWMFEPGSTVLQDRGFNDFSLLSIQLKKIEIGRRLQTQIVYVK